MSAAPLSRHQNTCPFTRAPLTSFTFIHSPHATSVLFIGDRHFIGARRRPLLTGSGEGRKENACGCSLTRNFCITYIKIVAAMLIIAGLITVAAIILNVLGLSSKDFHRKYLYYKIATYLALIAVLLELVSLVVFPVCFYLEMKEWGQRDWEFDWSYGVAWGSTLFTFGASLLLICDKEHEEIYYKEKTIYSPPPELK
uniref:Transmembrane protein 47 n=1 Tax=Plectus sambesii TaxID=2011161 RepID=A0A914WFX0_9BILA